MIAANVLVQAKNVEGADERQCLAEGMLFCQLQKHKGRRWVKLFKNWIPKPVCLQESDMRTVFIEHTQTHTAFFTL